MKEKYILIFTDDEIIFHKGSNKKIYPLHIGIERIQTELGNVFSLTPKVPFCFLIDRNHQDVREEALPSLFLWDRLRLLSHKRETWRTQGDFQGDQHFKQNGKSFLQWVNLTQNDPLIPWLLWIKSLSNPLQGVFFVSLEAGNFLKKQGASSPHYQMLIYKIASHKTRHVIFKGRRLLLFRPLTGEEDLRTSLHFLSRTFPDIHEKLQILNLVPDLPLTFPTITSPSDPDAFRHFLTLQKRPSLALNIHPGIQHLWIKRTLNSLLVSALCVAGIGIYQGLQYQREVHAHLSHINPLKIKIYDRKTLLNNRDMAQLRSALDHYHETESLIRDPFKELQKLSIPLEKHHIQLESLVWHDEESLVIDIGFFMQHQEGGSLSDQFNALLSTLAEVFPKSHLDIIEGPFKSSSHETYQYPIDLSPPRVLMRIVTP